MRSLVVSFLLLVGCTIQAPDREPEECSNTPAPASTGTAKPQPVAQKKGCGEIVVDCNCGATGASPGFVEASQECQSGYVGYDVCGQCTYNTYAWYSACVCQ